MSTKTLRKRIALVAVATLGAGVLSVAPANAASIEDSTYTTVDTAAAGVAYAGVCDAGTPSSSSTPRIMAVGGTSQVTVATATTGEYRITGPGEFTGGTAGYVGSTPTKFTVASTGTVIFRATGTGTIRLDAYADATDTTLSANHSWFFSVVAACGTGVSADKSYAQLVSNDNDYLTLAQVAEGRADGTYTASSLSAVGQMTNSQDEKTAFANAATAYISVTANNPQGYGYTTSSSLVIACTNNATIEGQTGGYKVVTGFVGYGSYAITQPTANVPLSTTCTFNIGGTVFATKTFKILGDIAAVALTHYKSGNAEASSSTTNDGQLYYVATDSAGNEVSAAAGSFSLTTASVTTRITAVSAYASSVGAEDVFNNDVGLLYYNCLDYGTQDLAVKITNTALNSITSNTVKASCGGAVNTYTASFDKAQYQTGDIATLTITAKDYAGGPVWYGATIGGATYGSFSVAVGGMTAVATPVSTDKSTVRNTGVWTYTYKVDTTAGSFVGQVALPVHKTTSANYNKPVLVQYKIVSSDGGVTNADVLKAIVSLIASINKQIAALQKALLKK